MSEQQHNQSNNSEQSYSFYWNYNNQLASDRREKEKKRKRGLWIYVILLTCIFLISFAILAVTVIWSINHPNAFPNNQSSQPEQSAVTTPTDTDPEGIEPPTQSQENANITGVVEKIKKSVVLIEVGGSNSSGSGTGFFLTSDGYIATNCHVIEDAILIRVTLYDGTIKNARLVGYRAEDDLAIIKIDGTQYQPLAIGDSDVLMAGDVAIAVGNPGGSDGAWTTTKGIVSATNRIVSVEEPAYFSEMKMIQTDAQVNPGNSGGPLCNEKGEVIGIITRKMTDFEGMGYAIPITDAMRTLNAIMQGKLDGFVSTVSKSRPKIGITGSEIAKGELFEVDRVEYVAPVSGFFVLEVTTNSGAYGIVEVGDILYSVNGVTVTDLESFKTELYKCYVGQKVTFELYRKGQKMTVQITVGVS